MIARSRRNTTSRRPFFTRALSYPRYDLRAMIAVTVGVAGVFTIAREDFFLAACLAIVIGLAATISCFLAHPRNRRTLSFTAGIGGGVMFFGLGIALQWLLFGMHYRFTPLVPMVAGVGSMLAGLAMARQAWGRTIRRLSLALLVLGVAVFAFRVYDSRAERWVVRQAEDLHYRTAYRFQILRGSFMDSRNEERQLVWLRRVLDLAHTDRVWISGDLQPRRLRRLTQLSRLRFLHFETTRVTDETLVQLGKLPQLDALGFTASHFPGGGLHLPQLPSLTSFECIASPLNDEDLRTIAEQKALKWLTLVELDVTAEGIRHLKRLPNLHWLQISQCDIGDDVFQHLGQFPRLTSLTLAGTQITDAGIALLRKHELNRRKTAITGLERLNLADTEITDACVADLVALSPLNELRITGTQLSTTGLQQLQQAMPKTKILSDVAQ